MFSYIEGLLVEKSPALAVIDCGGVGFKLNISLNTYSQLKEINLKCKLFTHLAIKSEATNPVGLVLYGFFTEDERSLFQELISVNGVGYNTARLILSSLTTNETVSAISNGDILTFRKVKGIGEKTAQRIIIELRDKISKISGSKEILTSVGNTLSNEALTALIMLGFNRNAALKAIDKVIKNEGVNITLEDIIKQSLKLL
ncbi:MAG TPA: Holliday junction branch migration protein RuvA [Bacteroidales bacterium]|nr:Holliday junction branch migration protein RuvA [Bacteroidales bacterium]HPS15779.1 Holliday junction branch migration protein RuvA [Bacteroidales bacterium]